MNAKRLLLSALVVVAAVGALGFALTAQRGTSIRRFVQEYRGADEQARVAIASRYLQDYPVSQLMDALEQAYPLSQCHSQGHAVGRALYQKDPNLNDAIAQCGSSCNYGCFHGVLMQMFNTDSDTLGGAVDEENPADYLASVQAQAKDLCARPDVASVVTTRFCLHGLGHVFAVAANYDLKKAVGACGVFQTLNIQRICAGGAFMEIMYSQQGSAAVQSTSAKPCDAFPNFLQHCFRYKARGWIEAWGGAVPAIKACTKLDHDMRIECIRGVGYEAARPSMMRERTGLDWLCGSLSGDEHFACVNGAIHKIVINDVGDKACTVLAKPFSDYCLDVLHNYNAVAI